MQSVHLGLVGHEQREQRGEPDRLGAELPPHRRSVARVEDEVDDGEHAAQPLRQQVRGRHPQRDAGVADLSLRADEPLRERRLRDEERARDLRRRQPAEQAQRQRHLRVGGERRVAAGEDQLEPLVGNHGLLVLRVGRGQLLQPSEELRLACQRPLAPDPVDRPVARGRDDPRAGIRGRAVARPPLQGRCERVLHRVLGEIEIAEDAGKDGDAAGTLVPIGAVDRVYEALPEWSTTGRISTVPTSASGIRSAHWSASSSDSDSIR